MFDSIQIILRYVAFLSSGCGSISISPKGYRYVSSELADQTAKFKAAWSSVEESLDGTMRSNVANLINRLRVPMLKFGESESHFEARPIDDLIQVLNAAIEIIVDNQESGFGDDGPNDLVPQSLHELAWKIHDLVKEPEGMKFIRKNAADWLDMRVRLARDDKEDRERTIICLPSLVPLPNREFSIREKCALLAAVHDTRCSGVELIKPQLDRDYGSPLSNQLAENAFRILGFHHLPLLKNSEIPALEVYLHDISSPISAHDPNPIRGKQHSGRKFTIPRSEFQVTVDEASQTVEMGNNSARFGGNEAWSVFLKLWKDRPAVIDLSDLTVSESRDLVREIRKTLRRSGLIGLAKAIKNQKSVGYYFDWPV